MSKATFPFVVIVLVGTALAGCNLPTQDPGAIQTSAAMTVQAQITASAPSATPTSTTAPFPTLPGVTSTVPAAASATPTCDLGQFIKDVTVPDGTVMTPGQVFTKTWRLKNIGACSWSGYNLIFDSGDLMAGTSPIAMSTVSQNQEVELSVNLTAPAANGSYRGYWRIRNASGVLIPIAGGYQGKSFYVDIKVQPAGPQTVDLFTISAEDGNVLSDGSVQGPPNVGDSPEDASREAFLSFNISGIPSTATITKVVTNFADYDTVGDPFSLGNDGCVRAYVQDYGTLDSADFFVGDPLGAVGRWCSASELNTAAEQPDMKTPLQAKLGSSRFQLRIQFRPPTTNTDGIADAIRFGDVKLVVSYTP